MFFGKPANTELFQYNHHHFSFSLFIPFILIIGFALEFLDILGTDILKVLIKIIFFSFSCHGDFLYLFLFFLILDVFILFYFALRGPGIRMIQGHTNLINKQN